MWRLPYVWGVRKAIEKTIGDAKIMIKMWMVLVYLGFGILTGIDGLLEMKRVGRTTSLFTKVQVFTIVIMHHQVI